ncbi:hypothetical protein BD289DRAFT_476974 [Coniella lustricola]|uniref:Uncharacterized protein n=1 Tax=Coniella lustricola TaxID=2025994 RepID=A0A2T2ZWI4_9PEZI|nr:hypothetical protein BD289DRAFT_476974 [Coniella lustricola]
MLRRGVSRSRRKNSTLKGCGMSTPRLLQSVHHFKRLFITLNTVLSFVLKTIHFHCSCKTPPPFVPPTLQILPQPVMTNKIRHRRLVSTSSVFEAGPSTPAPGTVQTAAPPPPAYSSPSAAHGVPFELRYKQPRTPPVPGAKVLSTEPEPEPEPEPERAYRRHHDQTGELSRAVPAYWEPAAHHNDNKGTSYEMDSLPYNTTATSSTTTHHVHRPLDRAPLHAWVTETPNSSSLRSWTVKLILALCIAILAAAVIALSIELAACNDHNAANQHSSSLAAAAVPGVNVMSTSSVSTLTSLSTSTTTATASTTTTVSVSVVRTKNAKPTTAISSVTVTLTTTATVVPSLFVSTSVIVVSITASPTRSSNSGSSSSHGVDSDSDNASQLHTVTRTVLSKASMTTASFTETLTTTRVGGSGYGAGTVTATTTAEGALGTAASVLDEYNCTPGCARYAARPGLDILDRSGNSSYCANIMLNIYRHCAVYNNCSAVNTVSDADGVREHMLEKAANCFFMCGADLITAECPCGLDEAHVRCAACQG